VKRLKSPVKRRQATDGLIGLFLSHSVGGVTVTNAQIVHKTLWKLLENLWSVSPEIEEEVQ
jgi:thiamine phosphate synthase YjbQ (UPF0047 family)